MRWEDLITEKEMYIAYRKVLMYNLLKYTSDSANVINLIIDYAVHPTTKANNLPILKRELETDIKTIYQDMDRQLSSDRKIDWSIDVYYNLARIDPETHDKLCNICEQRYGSPECKKICPLYSKSRFRGDGKRPKTKKHR